MKKRILTLCIALLSASSIFATIANNKTKFTVKFINHSKTAISVKIVAYPVIGTIPIFKPNTLNFTIEKDLSRSQIFQLNRDITFGPYPNALTSFYICANNPYCAQISGTVSAENDKQQSYITLDKNSFHAVISYLPTTITQSNNQLVITTKLS